MMRSPGSMAVVCRRRSGELVVRERPMPAPPKTGLKSLPFVRGVVTVVESLRLGSQCLRWSAELFEQDLRDEEEGPKPKAPVGTNMLASLSIAVAALAALSADSGPSNEGGDEGGKKGGGFGVIPILFAVALFVALPQGAAELVNKVLKLGLDVNSPGFQAITGACKLLIVVGYLLMIRRIPEVFRVFQYHGAEHKTISTYEATEELTVDNARKKTTAHPRCGTTFLVMVALVSIAVFTIAGTFLPKVSESRVIQSVAFFVMKLPFLPVVAALTYELQRVFARYCTTGPLRALLWPGFLVQKITTAEPDDAQLEVALASLRATLWREDALTAPAPEDRTFAGYGALVADPGYARA